MLDSSVWSVWSFCPLLDLHPVSTISKKLAIYHLHVKLNGLCTQGWWRPVQHASHTCSHSNPSCRTGQVARHGSLLLSQLLISLMGPLGPKPDSKVNA